MEPEGSSTPQPQVSPQEQKDGYDPRLLLQSLQFGYDFCGKCGKVPRNAVEAKCKEIHLFCEYCIMKHLERESACPIDGETMDTNIIQASDYTRSKILGLLVRCPNEILRSDGELQRIMIEDHEGEESDLSDWEQKYEPSLAPGVGKGNDSESDTDSEDIPPMVEEPGSTGADLAEPADKKVDDVEPADSKLDDAKAAGSKSDDAKRAYADVDPDEVKKPDADKLHSPGNTPKSQQKKKHKVLDCDWTGEIRELDAHMDSFCPLRVIKCEYADKGCAWTGFAGLHMKHKRSDMRDHLQLLQAHNQEIITHNKQLVRTYTVRLEDLEQSKIKVETSRNALVSTMTVKNRDLQGDLDDLEEEQERLESDLDDARTLLRKTEQERKETVEMLDSKKDEIVNLNKRVKQVIDQTKLALDTEKKAYEDKVTKCVSCEEKTYHDNLVLCQNCVNKVPKQKKRLCRWETIVAVECYVFIISMAVINYQSYDWADEYQRPYLKWLSATDNSIFQTMKLIVWPWLFSWFCVVCVTYSRYCTARIHIGNLGVSGSLGLLTSLGLIPALYHLYIVRMGFEFSTNANIPIFFLVLLIGIVIWIKTAEFVIARKFDIFVGVATVISVALWFGICSYEDCVDIHQPFQ